MNKYTLLLLSALSLSSFTFTDSNKPAWEDSPFDSVCDRMMRMHEEIDKMFTEVFNDMRQHTKITPHSTVAMPTLSQDEKTVSLAIQAPAINPDDIEIKKNPDANGDYVTISIPNKMHIMEMMVTPYSVTYSSKQETKEEKTNDDNNVSAVHYACGSSMMRQSLPGKISLDDIKAEYEKDVLTVIFQKMNPDKYAQKIPVVKK